MSRLGDFVKRVAKKHGTSLLGPTGVIAEDERRSMRQAQKKSDQEQLSEARNAQRQAAIDARKSLLEKQKKRRGFSSTLLTGGLGLTSPATASRKTLLGG